MEIGQVVVKGLDLITITVPPSLPMALAIGVIYAQRNLVKKSIFSISPNRINLAGGINLALFDKTGTLTEDGLTFGGLVENHENFGDQILEKSCSALLELAMAVCHTLTVIEQEIIGDPLEIEIVKSIKSPNGC